MKDFVQYWTRETIMNALGDEYKDKVKQEAGKESARTIRAKNSQISPIIVTNKGNTQEESNSSNIPETQQKESSIQ